MGFGFISPEQNFNFSSHLFLVYHFRFISLEIIEVIYIIWIKSVFIFLSFSLLLPIPSGEKAGLCVLGALCRGAARSRSALHFHISARLEGKAETATFINHSQVTLTNSLQFDKSNCKMKSKIFSTFL